VLLLVVGVLLLVVVPARPFPAFLPIATPLRSIANGIEPMISHLQER
jgi:hypothetical protein